MNEVYNKLLEIINNDRISFDKVVNNDNKMGLGITAEEIINYLEFSINEDYLKAEIKENIIITNGDVYGILKIIHDLAFEKGKYILYINANNISTNYYFIKMANKIYEALDINVKIKEDLSSNYNKYLNSKVILIGSQRFIDEAKGDFNNASIIVI